MLTNGSHRGSPALVGDGLGALDALAPIDGTAAVDAPDDGDCALTPLLTPITTHNATDAVATAARPRILSLQSILVPHAESCRRIVESPISAVKSLTGGRGPDRQTLARITREREAATAKYLRDRNTEALEAAMARLDHEEREARQEKVEDGVPAAEAIAYLKDLGGTWAAADGGEGRMMLAEALFERIEVRGFRDGLPGPGDAARGKGKRWVRRMELLKPGAPRPRLRPMGASTGA